MTRIGGTLMVTVKLGVSVALIVYAFRKIDAAHAFHLLQSVHPAILITAFGLLALQQIFGGLRLHRLLRLNHTPVTVPAAIDATFVGLFFGTTVISFISGDAARVWRISRSRVPVPDALQAVLFDRVFGFIALIALIGIELPMLFRMRAEPAMLASVALAVLIGVMGIVLFLLMNRLQRFLPKWEPVRLAAQFSSSALSIVKRLTDVSYLLGISVFLQVLNVLTIFVIGVGLRVEAPLGHLLAIVPPLMLLTMLPISFAGWGVRESAMIMALHIIGVPAEQSVALSICFGLCMLAAGLPGGLIWFVTRRTADPTEVSSSRLHQRHIS
jgi:glycosyltransferase 2 family protein